MAAWTDGYFTGIPYTSRFYPELAPGYLAFSCLRQGWRPPALGAGSAYLELGCGQGFGLNLLAAANPHMSFRGVDFHAGQIANARALAAAAGLANVSFDDLSFEQVLALPPEDLPRFDIVALHGVWSWVSPENRAILVRLLDRVVTRGGMVFVSYNCLPTWAPLVPLQRFVRDYVGQAAGDPEVEVVNALRAALELCDGKAAYFEALPFLRRRIEQDLAQPAAYLAHEYLNAQSQPFFHADVAAALAPAGLTFAASANLAEDNVRLSAPPALRPTVETATDPIWRETLLDYAGNRAFRRDVFLRAGERLADSDRDALLGEMRFALLARPEGLSFEYPLPIGRMKGEEAVYRPLAEALGEGPKSYAELTALPAFAGREARLFQALSMMVGARQAHPLPVEGRAEAATTFNRMILGGLPSGEVPNYLAAGLIGAGVRVTPADLAMLARREPALEGSSEKLSLFQRLGAF